MKDCSYPDNKGTTGYKYGCRCDRCTTALREYNDRWREANPEKDAAYSARYYQANREERNESERTRRAERTDQMRQWKQAVGCQHCGTSEGELDFDHIDPTTKLFDVMRRNTSSWELLFAEMAKCQVLCKPCHIMKTKANGEYASAV